TVFHLRTITSSEILGQPALEGVHSDGVDHAMTVFLKSQNMSSDSAKTRVHHNDEQTGKPWDAVDPRFVITEVQHRNRLDTLLVFDHERKHSVTPVQTIDDSFSATRDMLIFFTRKPTRQGHVSAEHDSQKPHQSMPAEVRLLD
ncbi:MAG TPA: 2OG-Fe dioxygenase family protein, partial [Pseudonocardiaceae bacterium]|nr:2OG-Fe dioxygenase family protein [Pseudonocardiaceae bacterium]